ncbi:MAG: NAD+ synthase [Bacillota bacterium]
MRVALAQVNPVIGNFPYNVARIEEMIADAAAQGADLVIFPEMALTGYPPRDLLDRREFIKAVEEHTRRLVAASGETGVILGVPLPDGEGALFNTALLFAGGQILGKGVKTLLPNYDVFDENRYFKPAPQPQGVTVFKGIRLGLTVCEDIWNDKDYWDRRRYDCDPVAEVMRCSPDLLVNISASPYHMGKQAVRLDIVSSIAAKYGKPVVYVNQAGGNDELIFDGSSFAVDARGQLTAHAGSFVEDLVLVDTADPAGGAAALEPPEENISWMYRALVLGIRDYMRKTGFSRAVIGLSGGIDSAVTAALAVAALGASNVVGIAMPSAYSSEGSVKDARELAFRLNIEFRLHPIEDIFKTYLAELNPGGDRLLDLAEENVQARIRGNILMFAANRENAIVLSTGNKSELAVGYCTLYGDMSGGLAVLADVPKVKVYELARYINSLAAVIPDNSITKPPSAELKPGQRDEDTLPPYPVLDAIIHAYIEENLAPEEIAARGLDEKVVREVIRKICVAEYKRRQAAPGLKVTTKAFGSGRRMPIAQGWCR